MNKNIENFFSECDAQWASWAKMVLPTFIARAPNMDTDDEAKYAPSVENQIRVWYESELELQFEALYDRYFDVKANDEFGAEILLAGYINLIDGEYFNNGIEEISKGRCWGWVEDIEKYLLSHSWDLVAANQIKRDCLILKGSDPKDIELSGIFDREWFEESLLRVRLMFAFVSKDLPLNH